MGFKCATREAGAAGREIKWPIVAMGFKHPRFERGLGVVKLNGHLMSRGFSVSHPLTRGKGGASLNEQWGFGALPQERGQGGSK